ncbi:dephospho-CoA kinase [Anaerotardibacter muris]|uniref:dephospho-CoA kinase n=1 Tax=Anaerotardibacter muris TaxID=2941505 RepID=UPI00203FDD9B|nr:dephospho-CoA kinase [Anaerotardibacter muris]
MAKRIFITGGIGSGKSTLLEFLRSHGAGTVEADKVGHEVLTFDDTKAELSEKFGTDIFDEAGNVMRPALAAKAFVSPEATALLDSVTLKRVYAESLRQLDELAKTHDVVALEMAILDGRDDFYKNADVVIAVVTSPEVRIQRLVERGLTEEDARNRLKNQVPDERREAIADVVFVNDGTIDEFQQTIDQWWESFTGGEER